MQSKLKNGLWRIMAYVLHRNKPIVDDFVNLNEAIQAQMIIQVLDIQ